MSLPVAARHRIQIFDADRTFPDQRTALPQANGIVIDKDQHVWIAHGTAAKCSGGRVPNSRRATAPTDRSSFARDSTSYGIGKCRTDLRRPWRTRPLASRLT